MLHYMLPAGSAAAEEVSAMLAEVLMQAVADVVVVERL